MRRKIQLLDREGQPSPSGWEWAQIGEIADFLDRQRVPVSAEEREKRIAGKPVSDLFPYYGANGKVGLIENYIFDEDLVLLAEDGGNFGDKGKSIAYEIQGKSWVNNHAHVLRPKQGIEIEYLLSALNHCDIMPYVRGTTRLKLNQSDARRIRVPLAPASEQRRIVAKVKALFAESKTALGALAKVPVLLRRFRHSVLAKAFRGELTQRDPNDESAQKLLERIRQERNGRKQTSLKENKELPTDLPKLPETWLWTTIGELETFIGSGITPRGGKKVYFKEGIPFIRSQNVYPDGLHLENVAYVTAEMHWEMKRTQVRQNDVLLNITGASIGRSTYIPEGFCEANVNQHVCIIRTGWWIIPAYLSQFLNSANGQDQIFATESGVTREGLNYAHVRSLRIPFSPLAEQRRIVTKIRETFSIAEQIEAAVKKARERIEKVDQSILDKAFRGKLVPQDSNDEPASVLLQRIKSPTGQRGSFQTKLHPNGL